MIFSLHSHHGSTPFFRAFTLGNAVASITAVHGEKGIRSGVADFQGVACSFPPVVFLSQPSPACIKKFQLCGPEMNLTAALFEGNKYVCNNTQELG